MYTKRVLKLLLVVVYSPRNEIVFVHTGESHLYLGVIPGGNFLSSIGHYRE